MAAGRNAVAVITVSREVGSEGRYIAEKVARNLGYHFVDKNTMQRILETHGIDEFQDEYHSSPSFWSHFTGRGERRTIMMDILRRATLALAHHGNVLMLGRGCYAMLGGFADVLNVRIQAPLSIRIERVMEKEHLAEREQAEAFVRETDEVRDSFVKACYDVRLDDAGLFDLVIDTGKLPSDMAADWLIQAVGALGGQSRRDSRTSDSIEADAVLTQLLWRELGCSAVHR